MKKPVNKIPSEMQKIMEMAALEMVGGYKGADEMEKAFKKDLLGAGIELNANAILAMKFAVDLYVKEGGLKSPMEREQLFFLACLVVLEKKARLGIQLGKDLDAAVAE